MTPGSWIPLPVALPLAAAAALAAGGERVPRWLAHFIGVTISVAVTALCAALLAHSLDHDLVHWFGGWRPRGQVAVGIAFVVDPIGAGLGVLSGVLVTGALVFAVRYFDTAHVSFHALMLTFLGALVGFGLAADLFNLFVMFELMSVAGVSLCGHKIEDEAAVLGAFSFGVTNTIGATLVLVGLAVAYAQTGALNFAQIRAVLLGGAGSRALVSFLLIACGFMVKAAVVPFHFWLDDAHAVAPTPVCVLFSGVMVEAALYAVARLAWTAFEPALAGHHGPLRAVFVTAGAVTAVLGAILCFAQRHLKRLLAFSTIAHVGIVTIAVGLFDAGGLAGAALYVVGHGLVKAALFMAAGIVLHRVRRIDEQRLLGRARNLPWVAVLLLGGGVALAAAPPFLTFTGDEMIRHAAEAAGYEWLQAVMIFASVVTAGAVLRVAGRACAGLGDPPEDVGNVGGRHDEPPETTRSGRTAATMWGPAAAALIGALVLGVWPGLRNAAHASAVRFVNGSSYASSVFGAAPPTTRISPSAPSSIGSIVGACASTAAAFALAGLALFRRCIPARVRRTLASATDPAVRILRAAHGGHPGEYVAWLAVGVALWCGFALLAVRFG